MKWSLRYCLRGAFAKLGYDLTPCWSTPRYTLLGLRQRRIRTVIDIGANRGDFTRWMMNIFPDCRCYCFEPLPELQEELLQLAHTHPCRITVIAKALGAEEDSLTMHRHIDHPASSSLLETTGCSHETYPFTRRQEDVDIQLTTLDTAMQHYTIEPETLIKMDCQGYEDRVVRGGRRTLSLAQACIMEVLVDNLYKDKADFRVLVSVMSELGFGFAGNLSQKCADSDGHVIFFDALFLRNRDDPAR